MRLLTEETTAVIVDIQERLFPFISDNASLAKNNGILIRGLHALDLPILVTEQYTKGLGPTIAPVAEALGDFTVLEKSAFSCGDDPGFMEALEKTGRKNVIVTGIESHVCVQQTALDLLDKGYRPVLVEDCVSSRRENDKAVAVARMRSAGVTVTTYESLLFELLRVSGTPAFKAISKLVK